MRKNNDDDFDGFMINLFFDEVRRGSFQPHPKCQFSDFLWHFRINNINISPGQGLDPGRTRFYKHTEETPKQINLTGLKKVLAFLRFIAKSWFD